MDGLGYRCIGKFGLFFNTKGCGETFTMDFDKCPICRVGYLIPESMITEDHKRNMINNK